MELTERLTFAPFTDGLPEPDPDRLATQTVRSKTILPE